MRPAILVIIVSVGMFHPVSDLRAADKELNYPPPSTPVLEIGNKMFCSAIMGSSLIAQTNGGVSGKGVHGKLFKGTDKIAIEVDGEALHFLTRAAFESGDTRDDSPFRVLINKDAQLVAIDFDEGRGAFVNVFSLNRKTGIAVWSKSRSIYFLTGNPDNQSYILSCEVRF